MIPCPVMNEKNLLAKKNARRIAGRLLLIQPWLRIYSFSKNSQTEQEM